MPLAIPAVLAATIGAGGAVASSVIGSKAAKSAQQAAQNDPLAIAQKQAVDQQQVYAKQSGDLAAQLFPKYTEGTDYLSNYWKSVLSPNNNEALKAIAPLVQARRAQTQGLLRNLDFAPRGGGYGAAVTDIYGSESRDILNTLAGERENARSGYASLIGDIGSRATTLQGAAAGVTSNAASLLGQMADRTQAQVNMARQQASNTTTNIADALAPLLKALIFKPKATTTVPSFPSSTSAGAAPVWRPPGDVYPD